MAHLQPELEIRKKPGVKRMKKLELRVDMTPMVDLGFLLIAFFILTTELTKPAVTKLFLPKDGPPMPAPESRSMTILVKDNANLFYYFGREKDAIKEQKILTTGYSEKAVGEIIRNKQISLGPAKDSLIVLIKASKNSSYKNVVRILDEMLINNVKRYSIVDLSSSENDYLDTH